MYLWRARDGVRSMAYSIIFHYPSGRRGWITSFFGKPRMNNLALTSAQASPPPIRKANAQRFRSLRSTREFIDVAGHDSEERELTFAYRNLLGMFYADTLELPEDLLRESEIKDTNSRYLLRISQ